MQTRPYGVGARGAGLGMGCAEIGCVQTRPYGDRNLGRLQVRCASALHDITYKREWAVSWTRVGPGGEEILEPRVEVVGGRLFGPKAGRATKP